MCMCMCMCMCMYMYMYIYIYIYICMYIYIICYYVLLFLQGFHTFLELRGFWDISRSSGTSKSAWWSRSFVQLGPHPELRCRSLAISAVSAVVLVVPTAVHFFHEAFYPTSL